MAWDKEVEDAERVGARGEAAVGSPKEIVARLKASLPRGTETEGSFKLGGTVPKTGAFLLHKGETVIPNQDSTQAPAAPAQSTAPTATPAPASSDDDSTGKGQPVLLHKAYSKLQESLTELADGMGVPRTATIPHIDGQLPADHIKAVGSVLAKAGGLTANLLTASHSAYGKNGGVTVAHSAHVLRQAIIPAKSELAKDAIDAGKNFVNKAALLIGDVDAIKTAKDQLSVLGRFDGQGMSVQDLMVALIHIPVPVIQAVARAHDRTKPGGPHPLRRGARL